jgi:hypothetical protein
VNHWKAPPHCLKAITDTNPESTSNTPVPNIRQARSRPLATSTWPTNRLTSKQPLRKVDVFVDDFMAAAQGTPQQLLDICRTLLHSLDEVLRKLDEFDNEHCKEPVLARKL